MEVLEPAALPRESADAEIEAADRPALIAWRIRRKVRTGGRRNKSRWRTVEGGLEAGEFAVRHEGRSVNVDGDDLLSDRSEQFDPFSTSHYHLGEPGTDVRLGDPGPLARFFERLGVTGENGLVSDLYISISVGGRSLSRDRFQASVIEHGDELAIRGTITETPDGPTLRRSEDEPPVVIGGNLEETGSKLRARAIKQIGFSLVMIVGGVYAYGYV